MPETAVKIDALNVSLDHSPSEQLGDDDAWHTSTAVLSKGNEHWEFSKMLATRLGMRDRRLRKWSGGRGNQSYRRKFEEEFFPLVADSQLHVRAVSADARTIRAMRSAFLDELEMRALVRESADRANYLTFGPFTRINDKFEQVDVRYDIHARRADYLVFLCWWLVGVHRGTMKLEKQYNPALECLDWFMVPNKFAGGVNGDMAIIFRAIMATTAARGLIAGNVRISTINDSKQDEGSALADNLAGYLNHRLVAGDGGPPQPALAGAGSSFLWSVHES
ncbi:MAG: hypothetical protein B7Y90_18345 [Alphaproteobacteria bacterium 32-64-14]|nr:MAG: hypothetical protein B7Y90_18345 [Alphaproteobacteria bacterium 32-64-14]